MTIGTVYLTVSNLDRLTAFYEKHIGFKLHRRQGDTVYLGAGGADLLVLTENMNAQRIQKTTGLYHFAVLVPSRLELAKSLQRLADMRTPLQGFADHWVSEAIYLADPDGNGIEIYRDRPRDQWPYQNNRLQMSTEPLDTTGILRELVGQDATWRGLHPDTIIGHIHLHVARLDQAEAFYRSLPGFDLVMRYGPSASFLSTGGYHHHIGINTWAGVGAPPPPPDALGLRWYTIHLPAEALDQALTQFNDTGIPVETRDNGYLVRDPAQNGILFTSAAQV